MGFWPEWVENTVDGLYAVTGKVGPFELARIQDDSETAIRTAVAQRRIVENNNPDLFESQEDRNARHRRETADAVAQVRGEVGSEALRRGEHPAQVDFGVAIDEVIGVGLFGWKPGSLTAGFGGLAKFGKGLLYVGGAAAAAVALFQLNKIIQASRKAKK